MSKISCFKGSKLEAKFNKKVEQGIDEYIAAREVLVEAYSVLNEQSNTLRKSLDLPAQDLIVEEAIVEDIVPQVVEYEEVVQLEEEVEDTVIKIEPELNTTQNFTGDAEYLTGEFISDFWAKALKAKQKDNAEWRNYYSHFGVNERGLYLINDDSITMSKIELYADEDIKQYSILSKQMQNIADKSEGIQSLRDEAINNPNSVKVFEGQISRLNEKEIVLKDSVDEFIRVGDDIFENIATESNLKHYVKLEKNNSEYYVVNTEKPKSELKLSDYKYLETTTDKFTTVKKYLANQNLEEFNC
jgi:hypothetical protein